MKLYAFILALIVTNQLLDRFFPNHKSTIFVAVVAVAFLGGRMM